MFLNRPQSVPRPLPTRAVVQGDLGGRLAGARPTTAIVQPQQGDAGRAPPGMTTLVLGNAQCLALFLLQSSAPACSQFDSRAFGAQTISCRAAFGAQTERCIDQNFKDRWRTLLSVDDMISEVFALTESVGVHDDTYYIYSSDHGYSLGELNLNWDKRNVCEQTTSLLSRPFCAFHLSWKSFACH